MAVIKQNYLLAIFLNRGGDRFCLICFCNFQTHRILNQHQLFCKDHDYQMIIMLQKFEMVLNKATNENEGVPGN